MRSSDNLDLYVPVGERSLNDQAPPLSYRPVSIRPFTSWKNMTDIRYVETFQADNLLGKGLKTLGWINIFTFIRESGRFRQKGKEGVVGSLSKDSC